MGRPKKVVSEVVAPIVGSLGTLLTEQDVARMFQVSVRSVQNWRYKPGCGPKFVRVARSVRYRLADVEAFVQDGAK